MDTVVGYWDAGYAYYDCLLTYGSKALCDNAIGQAIINDPGQVWSDMWRGVWDPIADDWSNGNYGEAVGRGAFAVAELIFGGKGASKALKIFKINPCSFTGDTPVLMADSTTKPISEIEPGDRVLASDPETGELSSQTVLGIWIHPDTVIDLQLLLDPDPDQGLGRLGPGAAIVTVSTTADHPFWNDTDQRWEMAGSLTTGDRLLAADGGGPAVLGLLNYTEREATAYNLTTSGPHTYYVTAGSTTVLVHNTNGGDLPGREEARLEVMRRAGIPLDATPIDTLRNASGVQYVYDVDGRYMLVTENTMDRSHPGQPHWEAGPAKPGLQVDNYGRYRVSNDKVKLNFAAGC